MEMPRMDVWLCRTAEDAARFLDWLDLQLNNGEVLAIDTETTGLEWWTYRFTRLWQVGTANEGWAVPVDWWGKIIDAAMQRISRSRTPVVFQNASFDMHAMEVEGWELPDWAVVHDTKFLLHLHRSDLSSSLKSKHTAELLGSWIFTGQNALKDRAKELGFKVSGSDQDYWRRMPVDEEAYWVYAVSDVLLTRQVFDALAHVRTEFAEAYERELRYQQIMYRAEKRGIRVDTKYTEELQVRLQRVMDKELHFCQANGLANPNSNDQVIVLLEEEYGFIPWEFTETGSPSVNKGVLAVLAEAGGMQADLIISLINYKRARKWKGTYADTFLERLDYDGFVHPSINTMGARTGRSSIQGPPLQTLPSGDPMIRRCLLPPKKHVWVSIDYSNQEPRTLAHYGQSPQLLKYFTEGDGTGSIHDFVAEQMFGPSYTKAQRSAAKIFGLSRSYGAGADKMAHASGLPLADVQAILPAYDRLVGLDGLKRGIMEAAADRQPHPYVTTSGGRRSYSDDDKEFTLVNYLMQGSGADMLKSAVCRLDDEGLADFIMVPVHDEVCFAFPKDDHAHLSQLAASIMRDDSFSVPMPVDIDGPGKSWGHIYDPEMD